MTTNNQPQPTDLTKPVWILCSRGEAEEFRSSNNCWYKVDKHTYHFANTEYRKRFTPAKCEECELLRSDIRIWKNMYEDQSQAMRRIECTCTTLKQRCEQLESELAAMRDERDRLAYDVERVKETLAKRDAEVTNLREAAKQPELPPLPAGDGDYNCKKCGQKTMHMGDLCYKCGQVPPPAPAFTVDKPGVYRQRNNGVVCITPNTTGPFRKTHPWRNQDSTKRTHRNDGHFCRNNESVYDLMEYLSPLPPDTAGSFIDYRKQLPKKYWCYSLCGVTKEWELKDDPSDGVGNDNWLYAEYVEPDPAPAPDEFAVSELQPTGISKFVTHWVEYAMSGREGE